MTRMPTDEELALLYVLADALVALAGRIEAIEEYLDGDELEGEIDAKA